MPVTLLSSGGGGVVLTAPITANTATLTFPQGSGTLLTDNSTSTLSNKTLNAPVLAGTLTAGGAVGTSGQALTSTGTGVAWANLSIAAGGTGATTAAGIRANISLDTTNNVTFMSVSDTKGNLRDIPVTAQTAAYTLVATDAGTVVSISSGGVTVPAGIFSIGNAISIWNNSGSSQTITQGSSVTIYNASTGATGNRTLFSRGFATLICVGVNTFAISGGGLT